MVFKPLTLSKPTLKPPTPANNSIIVQLFFSFGKNNDKNRECKIIDCFFSKCYLL